MALSQVALNVFYLFNGRKILCCPQRKAPTRALRLLGDVSSSGDVSTGTYVHPDGVWGSCCMAMSVQSLEPRLCAAGFGCQSCQGLQRDEHPCIPAACSSTVTVSCGGPGRAELCDWALSEQVCTEGAQANGSWARISWRRDPVDTVLQRLLPSLLYVCPIQCLFVIPCY